MKVTTLTAEELQSIVADAIVEAMSSPMVQPLQPLYTLADAAALFGKDERTLKRWAQNGTIKIAYFDGSRYVTGQSIANVMNK